MTNDQTIMIKNAFWAIIHVIFHSPKFLKFLSDVVPTVFVETIV